MFRADGQSGGPDLDPFVEGGNDCLGHDEGVGVRLALSQAWYAGGGSGREGPLERDTGETRFGWCHEIL